MAAMLLIGLIARRRIKNTADYVVAGRTLPLWVMTFTLLATWFCGGTVLGGSTMAYLFGLKGVIMDPIGCAVCLFVFGLLFAKMLRRMRYLTVVDFFYHRYGTAMGHISSAIQVLAYIAWSASLVVAFGFTLEFLLGWPFWFSCLLSTVIILIYTLLGGLYSVAWTDVVQLAILLVGFIIFFPIAISAVGGWGEFSANLPSGFLSISPDPNWGYLGFFGLFGAMFYFSSWIVQGFGATSCQDLVQRSLASNNEATSVWGSYFTAILYGTLGLIPAFVGMTALQLFPVVENPDFALFMVMEKVLPTALLAFMITALAAAIMSSTDSAILAGASVVGNNLAPALKPGLTDKQKLNIIKVGVVVIGFLALAIALWAETIYFLMNFAWALMFVFLFIPYLLGTYWKKANSYGAISSIFAALVVWAIGIYLVYPHCFGVEQLMEYAIWDAIYISDIPAFITSIVVFVVVSLATQKRCPPKPIADIDGKPVPITKRESLGFISITKSWKKRK